jgi:hypothetical protein
MLIRHALGVLGVLAAGVLLAVSAAMNWSFGYSLGRTEFDGQIYGAASVAADCMKALVPFFFFAAIRNRMWSQAAASAVVMVVVTAYSLTSALGHAALNRNDSSGQRVQQAQSFKDLRADLERDRAQLAGIPQHRPIGTVQSELDGLKTKREWGWSSGCTDMKGRQTRDYCQQIHALLSELASAQQAATLEARIAENQAKGAQYQGNAHAALADPQAAVLAKLAALAVPSIKVEDVQLALTIFVALLLEVGSGLGMYIAFSQWRLDERMAPAAPAMATLSTMHSQPVPGQAVMVETTAAIAPPSVPQPKVRVSANDNKSLPQAAPKLVAPENDVQLFYKERIETQDGSSLTATALYEDYCEWCEEQKKEPLALPTFGREFGELGVQKAKIAGRVRYIGIALRSGMEHEEDKKPLAYDVKAA